MAFVRLSATQIQDVREYTATLTRQERRNLLRLSDVELQAIVRANVDRYTPRWSDSQTFCGVCGFLGIFVITIPVIAGIFAFDALRYRYHLEENNLMIQESIRTARRIERAESLARWDEVLRQAREEYEANDRALGIPREENLDDQERHIAQLQERLRVAEERIDARQRLREADIAIPPDNDIPPTYEQARATGEPPPLYTESAPPYTEVA